MEDNNDDSHQKLTQRSSSQPQQRTTISEQQQRGRRRIFCLPSRSAEERGLRMRGGDERTETITTRMKDDDDEHESNRILKNQLLACHHPGLPNDSDSSSEESSSEILDWSGKMLIFDTEHGLSDIVDCCEQVNEDDFYQKMKITQGGGRGGNVISAERGGMLSRGETSRNDHPPTTISTPIRNRSDNMELTDGRLTPGASPSTKVCASDSAENKKRLGGAVLSHYSNGDSNGLLLAPTRLSSQTSRVSSQRYHSGTSSGYRNESETAETEEELEAKRQMISKIIQRCASSYSWMDFIKTKKQKLLLSRMNLRPAEIPKMKDLRASLHTVCLSGNSRLGFGATLPKFLTRSLPSLRVLDLSQCDIMRLPNTWNLPQLTNLNLSQNRLTEFPDEVMVQGLASLKELNLRGNRITKITLPANKRLLNSLQVLDMTSNDLLELPTDLTQLVALKTLLVAYNFLNCIPRQVGQMPTLKTMDTSGNPIVDPPLDICDKGLSAMKRYWFVMAQPPSKKKIRLRLGKLVTETNNTVNTSSEVATANNTVSAFLRTR